MTRLKFDIQKYLLRKGYLILLLVTLFLSQKGNGQPPEQQSLELVQTLSQYRQQVLLDYENSLDDLKTFSSKFDLSTEEDGLTDILLDALIGQGVFQHSPKFLLKRFAAKSYPYPEVVDRIEATNLIAILEHAELVDLMLEKIIELDYPYEINPSSSFFEEIAFYDLKAGDKIGEIGVGTGTFSLILGFLPYKFDLLVNELEADYLRYLKKRIDQRNNLIKAQSFDLIKGRKKSCNFPIGEMDKIIIRNAFHHFSAKEEMLASIKASLSPNGVLLLAEPVRELANKPGSCKAIMPKAAVVSSIEENGFELIDEIVQEHRYLFKFKAL